MQALREAKLKQFTPGTTLQNGRTALLYDDTDEYNGVVLGHSADEAMPYATWLVYWTKSSVEADRWFGSTQWGHYFPDFESAYRDYRERRDGVRLLTNFFSGVV